jgi:hypothetical protein
VEFSGEDADCAGRDGAWRGGFGPLPPGTPEPGDVLHLEADPSGSSGRVFEKKEAKTSAREECLSKELTRTRDVIAEITAQNLDLKKRSRLRGLRRDFPELQKEAHAAVQRTKERSGWPAKKTLAALGVPRGSYYRWLQDEAWASEQKEAPRPVQPFEAKEERHAVVKYAREHAATERVFDGGPRSARPENPESGSILPAAGNVLPPAAGLHHGER